MSGKRFLHSLSAREVHFRPRAASWGLVFGRRDCGRGFDSLLHVVVVGEDLHQEVKLKSLRLQNT